MMLVGHLQDNTKLSRLYLERRGLHLPCLSLLFTIIDYRRRNVDAAGCANLELPSLMSPSHHVVFVHDCHTRNRHGSRPFGSDHQTTVPNHHSCTARPCEISPVVNAGCLKPNHLSSSDLLENLAPRNYKHEMTHAWRFT